MGDIDYTDICQALARACADAGFDLVQPLCVGWYNRAVEPAYRVPDFGDPGSLAVVMGNTARLWSPFARAVADDPALRATAHPLQRYTARVIGAAVATLEPASEVRFDFEPPPRRVAMQDLAHIAGLAYKAPSFLSVHPTYGPWIGLRALIVVNVPGPSGEAPTLTPPCDCERGCLPALARAQATTAASRDAIDARAVETRWQAWLAVRDACPVGRAHRYSDRQIGYHYTKERHWLTAPDDDASTPDR